jgi:hypothetical protein
VENQGHGFKSRGKLTDRISRLSTNKQLNFTSCFHQLVGKGNRIAAESHSKRRNSLFRKARDMGLEISGTVALAADVILLTFIFVWKERQKGGKPGAGMDPWKVSIPGTLVGGE